MIIEGRHSEVGNGIFISDIQEGSVAEQVSDISVGKLTASRTHASSVAERNGFKYSVD